jgi:hypothetical protein
LLIVGADEDHTVPASLSKAQYERYEDSPAQTDYLEFEGRPHLHMAAPDWQEVAKAAVVTGSRGGGTIGEAVGIEPVRLVPRPSLDCRPAIHRA